MSAPERSEPCAPFGGAISVGSDSGPSMDDPHHRQTKESYPPETPKFSSADGALRIVDSASLGRVPSVSPACRACWGPCVCLRGRRVGRAAGHRPERARRGGVRHRLGVLGELDQRRRPVGGDQDRGVGAPWPPRRRCLALGPARLPANVCLPRCPVPVTLTARGQVWQNPSRPSRCIFIRTSWCHECHHATVYVRACICISSAAIVPRKKASHLTAS